MLIILKAGTDGNNKNSNNNNSELINTLQNEFKQTLVIPSIISEAEKINCNNYKNMLAVIDADDNKLGFSKFVSLDACPLGVYLDEDNTNTKYFIPNPNIDSSVSPLDYIKIRITSDKSYISYKYAELAYTLEIDKKENFDELVGHLGAKTNDLIETTKNEINDRLGLLNKTSTNNVSTEYKIGKFYIPVEHSKLGLTYGIDIDNSVNFYLDSLIVLKITDSELRYSESEIQNNIEVLESSLDNNIKIVKYKQDFKPNSPEYTVYMGLEILTDSLKNTVNYINKE